MSTIIEPPESPQIDAVAVGWRWWPVRQEPLGATLAAMGLVALGALIQSATASLAMVCLSLFALALAAWRLFVPIEFTVDDGGIKQQWPGGQRFDDWNSFRAFSPLAHGFVLWPSGDCCFLDATRSLYVPCSSQRAELTALLLRHLVEIP